MAFETSVEAVQGIKYHATPKNEEEEVAEEQARSAGVLQTNIDAIMEARLHRSIYDRALKGEIKTTGDPLVEQSLEGGVLKFQYGPKDDQVIDVGKDLLGFATGDKSIPWDHKRSLAGVIALGDQIGDVWRGMAQIAKETGVADVIDIEQQDQNEEILRRMFDDPEYGWSNNLWTLGGLGLGASIEPVSLVLPFGKGRTLWKGFRNGALWGSIYGSALYVDKEESRWQNALVMGLFSGAVGGAAAKYTAHMLGQTTADVLDSVKPHYVLGKGWIGSGKVGKAVRAKDKAGNKLFSIRKAGKRVESTSETLARMEARASIDGPRIVKAGKLKDYFDQAVQPLYDYVNRYAPKVAAKMRDADAWQHVKAAQWTERTDAWNKLWDKLGVANQQKVQWWLANEGVTKKSLDAMADIGGNEFARQTKLVKGLLNEVGQLYKKAGYRLNMKDADWFFPTGVRPKGLQHIQKKHQTQIDKAIAKARKANKGKPLTPAQEAHVAERLFTHDMKYSTTSPHLKKRTMPAVEWDELQYYQTPKTMLHYYLATAAEDIAKRNFFKEFGHKAGKGGLDVTGADLEKSIDSLIVHLQKQLPDPVDQQRVVQALKARFSADVHKTDRLVQGLKNASYGSTLGNWWAALTQIGDLVFVQHKYGIKAMASSILGPRVTTREKLGVTKAMQELVDPSERAFTARIADFAFKWSGFDLVDGFGKNININASLRVNKKLALKDPAKFRAKWADHFGDQTDALISELQGLQLKKDAALSDNAYLMLWNDLAETQPIGLSEVPKKYLDMPNGRIIYAYKTFAMKQFNYMRNLLTNPPNPNKSGFQRGKDLVYFGSLFVAANSTVDAAKDVLSGKDLDIESNVFDNILQMAATNKYAWDKSRGGLGDLLKQLLYPVPIQQGWDVLSKTTRLELTPKDVGEKLPLIGRPIKEADNWFGPE